MLICRACGAVVVCSSGAIVYVPLAVTTVVLDVGSQPSSVLWIALIVYSLELPMAL